MFKFITASALVAALAIAPQAFAQTLRWASQGDPQTMDPHSQNESMTNMMNGQVYERLVARDKTLAIVPGAGHRVDSRCRPLLWRFKLRPNVKFHDGTPFTADDVVFSIQRGQQPTSTDQQLRQRRGHAAQGRRPDGGVPARRAQPDLPAAPGDAVDHEQGVEREEQGHPSRWTSRTRKRATPR